MQAARGERGRRANAGEEGKYEGDWERREGARRWRSWRRAGKKEKEEYEREEMEEANGKRRRKSRACNSRLRWEFSKLPPDLLRARHFLPPSRTFPPLIRSPLSALSYLLCPPLPPLPPRQARSSINGSWRGGKTAPCVRASERVRVRLYRFHVMRNLACTNEVAELESTSFKSGVALELA